MAEFGGNNARRMADLATHQVLGGRQPGVIPAARPVLSVRAVRGNVPSGIYTLGSYLQDYDGYIQSTVGANDDREASATLHPRRVVEREELMAQGGKPRVVVAMRLHAALMALAAGHYVVHLAYERKGFGAYDDLGLQPWVHNVNSFDPAEVSRQVTELLEDSNARAEYDRRILASGTALQEMRKEIVRTLRAAADRHADGYR